MKKQLARLIRWWLTRNNKLEQSNAPYEPAYEPKRQDVLELATVAAPFMAKGLDKNEVRGFGKALQFADILLEEARAYLIEQHAKEQNSGDKCIEELRRWDKAHGMNG